MPDGVREVGALLPLRWYQIGLRRIVARGGGLRATVALPLLALYDLLRGAARAGPLADEAAPRLRSASRARPFTAPRAHGIVSAPPARIGAELRLPRGRERLEPLASLSACRSATLYDSAASVLQVVEHRAGVEQVRAAAGLRIGVDVAGRLPARQRARLVVGQRPAEAVDVAVVLPAARANAVELLVVEEEQRVVRRRRVRRGSSRARGRARRARDRSAWSRPARAMSVGKRSMFIVGASTTRPAGSTPGHEAISGTRMPPSSGMPLRPRSPSALPWNHGPLSLVKTSSVSSRRPRSASAFTISPTLASSSATESP